MKLIKSLNNNVALALNKNNEEIVLFGTGIGFKKKLGDFIDEDLIQKTFRIRNQDLDQLLNTISAEVIELVQKIIIEGQKQIQTPLSETILLSLCDHLNFAIQRYHENIIVKSPLHWEIRHLYPHEFAIGLASLKMVEEALNISLNISEASFIALHFVNAQYENNGHYQVSLVNDIVQKAVSLIDSISDEFIDKTSISYSRFITHLRYFIMRYQSQQFYQIKDNDFLYMTLKERYPISYQCTIKLSDYLLRQYHWELNNDEVVCLLIHIERLRSN